MAIGFGAGIPIILAIAGLLLYYWNRHRKKSCEVNEGVGSPGKNTKSDGTEYYKAELSGESRPISEMPGSPTTLGVDNSTISDRSPGISQSPFVSPIQSEFSGNNQDNRMVDFHGNQIHELPA